VSKEAERREWRTPAQIAFSELVERTGWKPVRVAEFLGVSKGAVSRWLNCKRDVPATIVELFRRKLEDEDGRQGDAYSIKSDQPQPRNQMKYPSMEDVGGSPMNEQPCEAAIKKLEELSKYPAEFREVASYIDYRHSKLKKKK
jgi:predicted transcriptional regulator